MHNKQHILNSFIPNLQKGGMPIGTVSKGYKKIADTGGKGDWVKVDSKEEPKKEEVKSNSRELEIENKIKAIKDEIEALNKYIDRFPNSPKSEQKIGYLAKELKPLREELELLQFPIIPLTKENGKLYFQKYIRNQNKLKEFLKLTDKSTLEYFLDESIKREKKAELDFMKERGYGLYSDENGGGPVEFYWEQNLLEKELKNRK